MVEPRDVVRNEREAVAIADHRAVVGAEMGVGVDETQDVGRGVAAAQLQRGEHSDGTASAVAG